MSKVYYVLFTVGVIFAIIGIISSFIMESCYEDYLLGKEEGKICKWMIRE